MMAAIRPILMPTESEDSTNNVLTPPEDDLDEPFTFERQDTNDVLCAQWEEALEQCWAEHILSHEKKEIQEFKSPGHLLKSLELMKNQYKEKPKTRLLSQIAKHLESLDNFAGMLATALALQSFGQGQIETTLLWGSLHLAIKGAINSDRALASTADILKKTSQQLRILASWSKKMKDMRHIRQELVDMFVALIHFWSEAVCWFRRSPIESALDGLNEGCNKTLKKLEESVDIIEKHAREAGQVENPSDILSNHDSTDDSKATFPCTIDLPWMNPYFKCRKEELDKMTDFFKDHAERQQLRCFAIFGIAGVGKSALAHAFASKCITEKKYDAIIWVKSQTLADLRSSYSEIARQLRLPKGDENDLIHNAKLWLKNTARTWLLIFDNVDDIKSLIENKFIPYRGDMIITTRYSETARGAPGLLERLELDVLNTKDALEVFNTLRSKLNGPVITVPGHDTETAAIETMLGHLNGHVLAIEQMAAYIAEGKITCEDFLAEYEKRDQAKHIHRFKPGSTQHSLATLWDMHFESLNKSPGGQSALRLLSLLSLLAPDAIPLELFEVGNVTELSLGYGELCKEQNVFTEAYQLLVSLALIKKSRSNLSLHRLVQKAYDFSDHGHGDQVDRRQTAFNTAAILLNEKFPKMGGVASLYAHWEECSKLLTHCQHLGEIYWKQRSARVPIKSSPKFEELLKNCAWYLLEVGEADESLHMIEIAQDACVDKEGVLYSQLCNNAGCIQFEKNSNVRCWENFSTSLRIRKKLLPPDHSDLANTYNNIGNYYASIGQLDDALAMHTESFKIRDREEDRLPQYKGLSNLGIGKVFALRGDYVEAENRFEKARKFVQPLGQSGYWLMAIYHFDKGNLDCMQGHYEKAQTNFERGLQLVAAKPRSMMMATLLYKTAMVRFRLGDFTEVVDCLDKAIIIAESHNLCGHAARSIHLKASVVAKKTPADRKESQNLKMRAYCMRLDAIENGDIGNLPLGLTEEQTYDRLVCLYHR